MMLGITAANIPFPDHNQSPRNTYECLKFDTKILMASGDHKKICDVKVGEKVITFDPITMEESETQVINQFVRKTDKKIYEITTFSERKIIATYDHKFITNEGWKCVEDFSSLTTCVGISLGYTKWMPHNVRNIQPVLNEDDVQAIYNRVHLKHLSQSHISCLKDMSLVPLLNNDERLPIIAR